MAGFGSIFTVEADSACPHTHTAILLHGRGSDGEEFAEELFESTLPGQPSLRKLFPGWRWVFPSSKRLWSTAFEEEIPAWFEAHSLGDPTSRQELQMPGIQESVRYLSELLDTEITRLGGDAKRTVLGGISQGGAIGMWTLLTLSVAQPETRKLGGFIGVSTWLPFAEDIKELFKRETVDQFISPTAPESWKVDVTPKQFVSSMMGQAKAALDRPETRKRFLRTPIFMGHGMDDGVIDFELGQQARDVLAGMGLTVEWKKYSGAEQEGHWFKIPDELDDIVKFFAAHVAPPAELGVEDEDMAMKEAVAE